MADLFTKHVGKHLGPGGPRCPCCRPSSANEKRKVSRASRARIKARDIRHTFNED